MKNKYKLLVINILFLTSIYSQNKFSKGFEVGYSSGYCYDKGIGCLAPIPPISPIPKIGESSDSYIDGYNRGFIMGVNKQREDSSENRYSQQNSFRQRYYTTAKAEFIDDFAYKPPFELMAQLLAIKNANYQREKQTHALNYEIKKHEINEEEFAIINIYRPKKSMGSLLPVQVIINGIEVADLSSGGHLEYRIHDLSACEITIKSAGIATLRLMPKNGKVYYFETKPKFSGFTLEQIQEAIPQKNLKEKKYINKVDYIF